jgi:uncharacterized repeat protein (TIGR01451 family)
MPRVGVLLGAVVLAALVAGSSTRADAPGNSVNAAACQKGGWTGLFTRSGDPFSSSGACTSYGAQGGQLIVAGALVCLSGGWQTLGSTPSQPFASEQACVDFANGGGTPVALGADLAVSKSVDVSKPNVGDVVTFTVGLTDNGPLVATGVTVSDVLPAGLSFVSATPTQGSYTPATGVWTVGTVTTATPQTLLIQARVVSPAAETNTAAIGHADQPDPNPANNAASATVVPQAADLAVAKKVDDSTPNVGDVVTFTVTLTDGGPDAATGVTVSDVLPAGLSFVSATPSQGSYTPATGVWTVGTVTTATPQTLLIQARVVSPAAETNTAAIGHADQFDPNTANNTASATLQPITADLAVTQTVDNSTPNLGDVVTFTVTLTNNGPDAATGVWVVDQLPTGLAFVSATPNQGTYAPGTGLWTVGNGTVAPGTSQTLLIQAQVISAEPQTNTASVGHAFEFDPNTANNSASITV